MRGLRASRTRLPSPPPWGPSRQSALVRRRRPSRPRPARAPPCGLQVPRAVFRRTSNRGEPSVRRVLFARPIPLGHAPTGLAHRPPAVGGCRTGTRERALEARQLARELVDPRLDLAAQLSSPVGQEQESDEPAEGGPGHGTEHYHRPFVHTASSGRLPANGPRPVPHPRPGCTSRVPYAVRAAAFISLMSCFFILL